MSHYDSVIMPTSVQFRDRAMPMVAVDLIFFDSGYRATNNRWDQYLRTLTVDYVDKPEQIAAIYDIWMAMTGPANSFLCKDWSDWNSTEGRMRAGNETFVTPFDQPLKNTANSTLVGDGVTKDFQLVKRYLVGGQGHLRTIKKPKTGSIVAGVNGASTTAFTVNTATGVLSFTVAPANGVLVTWGGQFWVPVAFTAQQLEMENTTQGLQTLSGIELREVRL